MTTKKQIESKIEQAKGLLSDAAKLACPLAGYCDQWEDIGRTYDAVEGLWWRIHEGPQPGPDVDS